MCICARHRLAPIAAGARLHLITDPVHYRHISMTVSTLSAQEGDTAVTHPSTGLFSRKTLPIALQTSDLGVFLAETLPDCRTQGLCARTFAQNVLEKRVTIPHRARFRLKRARMRGSRGSRGSRGNRGGKAMSGARRAREEREGGKSFRARSRKEIFIIFA